MKKRMLNLSAVICAGALVLSGTSALSFAAPPDASANIRIIQKAAALPEDDAGQERMYTNNGYIPVYYHYDPEDFYEKCDLLKKAAKNNDIKQIKKLYCYLFDELDIIAGLNSAAYYEYSNDVTNEQMSEETAYIEEVLIDCADRFCIACRTVLESDSGRWFADFIRVSDLAAFYYHYEDMDQEMLELTSRETALENKYDSLASDLSSFTATVDGKTYDLEYLISDEAYSMALIDYDTYQEAFYACIEDFNKQTGEIYLELVKIRDRMAELEGYDSFNEYADKEIYGRDYDAENLAPLKEAAKKICGDYLIYGESDGFDLDVSYEELMDMFGTVVEGISPLSDSAYELLTKNELYSVGNWPGMLDGGYTLTFPSTESAAIFLHTDSSFWDLIAMVHEFGHFTNAVHFESKLPVFFSESLDLDEVHSNGLQLLATERYAKVVPEHADEAVAFNITNELMNLVEGCIYDDFQRKIYDDPDMTLDEINDLYESTAHEYYPVPYPVIKYEWSFVPHNFSSPIYYISYAASSFAALQIWDVSRTDYEKAVGIWEKIMRDTASDDGYLKVLENAGLKTFKEEGAADELLERVIEYLKKVQTH